MRRFRFYKGTLPAVVWDPEKGRPMAEFVNGQFYTDDVRVASILKRKGYIQVDLEATEPPPLPPDPIQPPNGPNIPVLGPGITEDSAPVVEERIRRAVSPGEERGDVSVTSPVPEEEEGAEKTEEEKEGGRKKTLARKKRSARRTTRKAKNT